MKAHKSIVKVAITEITMTEEECIQAIMSFEEINAACSKLLELRNGNTSKLAMIISDELGNLRELMGAIGVKFHN